MPNLVATNIKWNAQGSGTCLVPWVTRIIRWKSWNEGDGHLLAFVKLTDHLIL